MDELEKFTLHRQQLWGFSMVQVIIWLAR